MPVDEAGRFYDAYGWLHGLSTGDARGADHRRPRRARPARRGRRDHAPLPRLLALPHAADLPHRRRVVHLGRRDPSADARGERDRRVDARLLQQADGRLAAQHGRLEHLAQALLRPAAAVLPVRVRASERDRLARPSCGSARPTGSTSSRELHRPWIDEVPIRASSAARRCAHPRGRRRWLDAGIVPFSTLGWQNDAVRARGLRGRRRGGAHRRRPARPRLLGDVVPGRLGLGDRASRSGCGSTRSSFMSVALDGRGAVPAGAGVREAARRDRPRDAQVVGQRDRCGRGGRADGRRRHALAVRRPGAEPEPELRLRARERGQAAPADVLELGCSSSSPTRTIEGFRPTWATRSAARRRAAAARPLAARADAAASSARRTRRLRARSGRPTSSDACERVRRRPLELVHPPLAAALLARATRPRSATLWTRSCRRLRVISPVMPFLAEELWQRLVARRRRGRARLGLPRRLAGAGRRARRRAARREMREVRRVVALGHQARAARRLKLRQPLRPARRRGRAARRRRTPTSSRDELRVKEVEFGRVEATELHVKPHLPVARPQARQGARRPSAPRSRPASSRSCRAAASASAGHELAPGRGARRALGHARAGRSRPTRASRSRSTRRSTRSSSSRAASTTSSTRSTRCARSRGSS